MRHPIGEVNSRAIAFGVWGGRPAAVDVRQPQGAAFGRIGNARDMQVIYAPAPSSGVVRSANCGGIALRTESSRAPRTVGR